MSSNKSWTQGKAKKNIKKTKKIRNCQKTNEMKACGKECSLVWFPKYVEAWNDCSSTKHMEHASKVVRVEGGVMSK